jgi:hypothetical protein
VRRQTLISVCTLYADVRGRIYVATIVGEDWMMEKMKSGWVRKLADLLK